MLRDHFHRCLIFIISSSNVVFLKHASSKLVYIARSKYEVAQSSGGSVSLWVQRTVHSRPPCNALFNTWWWTAVAKKQILLPVLVTRTFKVRVSTPPAGLHMYSWSHMKIPYYHFCFTNVEAWFQLHIALTWFQRKKSVEKYKVDCISLYLHESTYMQSHVRSKIGYVCAALLLFSRHSRVLCGKPVKLLTMYSTLHLLLLVLHSHITKVMFIFFTASSKQVNLHWLFGVLLFLSGAK